MEQKNIYINQLIKCLNLIGLIFVNGKIYIIFPDKEIDYFLHWLDHYGITRLNKIINSLVVIDKELLDAYLFVLNDALESKDKILICDNIADVITGLAQRC